MGQLCVLLPQDPEILSIQQHSLLIEPMCDHSCSIICTINEVLTPAVALPDGKALAPAGPSPRMRRLRVRALQPHPNEEGSRSGAWLKIGCGTEKGN